MTTDEDVLLAWLFDKGLVRSPEVTTTQSIAYLCGRRNRSQALNQMIQDAGLEISGPVRWIAEVTAADRSRTDLECWWGDRPRVVVEAKIDALLTVGQLSHYIHDLARRSGDPRESLFVVLVPAQRAQEARHTLDSALRSCDPSASTIRTAVWTYDEVFLALDSEFGKDDSDVKQAKGFVQACAALDIAPFDPSELLHLTPGRHKDLDRLLQRVGKHFDQPGDRFPFGMESSPNYWRRYIGVHHPDGTCVSIGIRTTDPDAEPSETPVWLRVHRETPHARTAASALLALDGSHQDSHGHVWLPIHVPVGVGGAAIVEALVAQTESAVREVADALKT